MTTFYVPLAGNWSGGGKAVLQNFQFAAARHREISLEGGEVTIVNRNLPNTRIGRDFVLIPQNAWPWEGPKVGAKEKAKLVTMRLGSEIAMRYARGVVRVGRSIPRVGNAHDRILPNPLDIGFEAAITSIAATPGGSGDPYFASIGSMYSYRGLEALLAGYALYQSRGGTTSLIIAGRGKADYVERIRICAARTAGVTIVGGMPRRQCLQMLKESRLAVLPSHVEASPFSLLEALAVQPNVAASDIAGHRDIVPPGTEHPSYFRHDDPSGLAELMQAADVQPHDRSAHHLADADFRTAERERWSEDLVRILTELMDSGRHHD